MKELAETGRIPDIELAELLNCLDFFDAVFTAVIKNTRSFNLAMFCYPCWGLFK